MAIEFLPSKMKRKVSPTRTVERLVTNRLTLNKAVVATLAESEVLSKKKLETIALKVIKSYKKTYGVLREETDLSKADALAEAMNGRKLMVQRVQNAVVHEISNDLKDKYRGEYYIWLPSDANEPDPLHQLNYGQVFQLGVGEQPGDRFGCECGMRILVAETKLKL